MKRIIFSLIVFQFLFFNFYLNQANAEVNEDPKKSLSNLSDAHICSWFDLKNVPDQYIYEATKRNLSCNGKVLIKPSNNIKIPANAYKSGNTWYCKSGYKKSGNVCNKIATDTKKSDSQYIFGYIFALFLLIIFILIISSPKNSHKKCAWCNNSKIKFIKGVEQEWFWRYSNKDGSRDKRRKNNYQQAKFKSKFQCQKCNASTGFLHEESQRPGPNTKIIKRKLLQGGSGERKGTNYE